MRSMLLAICLLNFVSVACNSASSPAFTPSTPSVVPQATEVRLPKVARTATPPAGPMTNALTVPDGVLVVYQRTGCFTGVDEILSVYADGKLTFKAKGLGAQQAQVAAERLVRLKQLLSQPAFAALDPAYEAKGADLCAHFVAVRASNGQTREVLATDEATVPQILADVLSELRKLREVVQ